ncbi:arylsulfatase I-like [Haemaphysalis longicornis]
MPGRRGIVKRSLRKMAAFLLLFGITMATSIRHNTRPPHIVFILADDLGIADISVYGSSQIPTPNLDAIASEGVILNNYYVQPLCSPSRGSLMSGLYPIHTGMQHRTLFPMEPAALPLHLKILPEHLKHLGYETHCVGKWGIGHYTVNHTPTHRGFDTFYGTYMGPVDYYTHKLELGGHRGLDFWENDQPLASVRGRYLTTLFEERAEHIIANRNTSKPLFLLLAHQATHGVPGKTPAAPRKNIDKFFYIRDEKRRAYAGMVDALDETIGRLMEALERASMLQDTLIVFSSDNGGFPPAAGYNWPLRGIKGTLWEGAVRAAAFVWSPRLQKSRRVSQQMMHITDWLPTLYASAGGDTAELGSLDGMDMWQALSTGGRSPRTEILHNIDSFVGTAALRFEDFKLIVGISGNLWDAHNKIPAGNYPYNDLNRLVHGSKAASVLTRFYTTKCPMNGEGCFFRKNATISCRQSCSTTVDSGHYYHLFDVSQDPCELRNLAQKRPAVLYLLLAKLTSYSATVLPMVNRPIDPKSFPENHNGVWAPWIPHTASV